jgi:hypothetical protein
MQLLQNAQVDVSGIHSTKRTSSIWNLSTMETRWVLVKSHCLYNAMYLRIFFFFLTDKTNWISHPDVSYRLCSIL